MIRSILLCILNLLLFSKILKAQSMPIYDIVLAGGRVMDPDSKLDAIRHVGINNGRIEMISPTPLQEKEVVDVSGLVVSPGFIDLHIHGRTNTEQEYQVHDGVTTGLELKWGVLYRS